MNLELLSDDGDVALVGAIGEISQIRFQSAGNPLEELLGPSPYKRRVLVDFEKADWIDSSGISWLIASHKRFRDGGGCLVFFQFPPRVRMVLEFCKIDSVLNVATDQGAARALVARAAAALSNTGSRA
jgi:anti-anti-sigma factor